MIPFLISLAFSILYVSMQTVSIYAGDSGKLVAAAYTWSIAHPPGYPLYMLLGGIITHLVSVNTVAWRMGLLSSIPMAFSIYFVWRTVFVLSKSKLGATVSSILYGLLYPVWLYGMVPEVFGLFSLLSALICYLFIRFVETKKSQFLFLLAFFFGLSLTHHHLVVLLLFSIAVTLFLVRKSASEIVKPLLYAKNWKWYGGLLFLFLLGFSLYLYAPIVSSRYPSFDWEHPATLDGLIRLVTRVSFGTFKATYSAGNSLLDRGLNLLTFFQYLWKDFSLVYIGFFLAGMYFLRKVNKSVFVFFTVYLFVLLFFFFYAGFPVHSDFLLGTLERFFIVPYQTISIVIGVGIGYVFFTAFQFWKKHKKELHMSYVVIQILCCAVFGLGFIRTYRINNTKLSLLTNDRTLEKLADDIFAGVPEGSILNLQDDTSTFAVDYAYYVQKKRQDIRLLSFPMMQFPYYPTWIKHNFPDVVLPKTDVTVSYKEYLSDFLQLNYPQRPIVSERVNMSVSEFWVPRGLVVMYYPTLDVIPNRSLILEKNESLWNVFQDPLEGTLGRYKHMMLTDVLRYYAEKKLTLAESFLLYGQMNKAEEAIQYVLRIYPNRPEIFVLFIDDLIKLKKCDDAHAMLVKAESLSMNKKDVLEMYHKLYEECSSLQKRLESKEREYQLNRASYAQPIE
jgi:hypothetical protein